MSESMVYIWSSIYVGGHEGNLCGGQILGLCVCVHVYVCTLLYGLLWLDGSSTILLISFQVLPVR